MRYFRFSLVAILTFAFVPAGAIYGQVTTATIYGTVVDATNARIPGADVTLTQQETGTVAMKISDETGNFQFDFLRPGTYSIAIELSGFRRYEARGLQLGAGQSIRQTYVLQVGQATDNVLVEAAAPLVNTVSTEQQTTFTNRTVAELPLQRRNFSGILAVGTGIAIAGGGSSEGIRMNGVGRAGTGVSVDGTDAKGNLESRGAANFNGANYIDTLSSESIAEVNVVKGVLPAEYGSVLGGQVNVMTRSGTNDWHGSLFENYQSASLNARDPFLNSKPPFVYNQFGGSIGGPIVRNRVFIFGAYEGYRESRFRRVESNVPTAYLRSLMTQAVPKYEYTLQVLPLPNEPHSATANTGRFVGTASDRRQDDHFDFKGDIKFVNNSNLAITYSRGRPGRTTDDVTSLVNPEWGSVLNVKADRAAISYVTGGASWTSETRYGYNRSDTKNDFGIFGIFDPENPNEQFAYGRRVGIIETNLGFNTPAAEQIELLGPTWNLSEKFAKHVRDHSLKFGAQYTHQCCRRGNVEAVRWNYQGLTDLLANIPSRVDVAFGQGEYEANMWELGLFIQDDWRIHPRLTLNLGLRYDYFSHMVATPDGPQGSFLVNPDGMDMQFNIGPIRPWQNPYESDSINFGPRFGFAYNVDGNGRTVIRGGGGLLYSSFTLAALWSGVHSEFAPRRVVFSRQDALRFGLKYPMYNDDMRPIVEQLIRDQGIAVPYQIIDPNIQNPYTVQYTLGIQRELTPNLALDTAFVSTLGRKFLTNRTPNEPDRITGIRPNPNLNTNYYLDGSQTSSYFSWQTSLTKRYSRNLSGSVHYTWGKALATGGADVSAWYQGDNSPRYQDFFDLKNAKGPGQGDIAHYFTAQTVYQLPALQNFSSSVARQVLGGWQLGGILRAETGSPLAITQSSSLRHARPDQVLGQDPILDNWRNTHQYLNPAAFARVPLVPASGAAERPGTLGWGAIRGPGMWQLDASLAKNFSLTEGVTLQIRSDMFNAFNRQNYSNPTTSINSSFFGQIRGTRGQRVIQFNGRLSF